MTQAKKGDTVKIQYTGRLQDGSEFDSSSGKEPLQFSIGSGQVIPGFDEAVTGMEQKFHALRPMGTGIPVW
jgi:peptidylprolyl isomerase